MFHSETDSDGKSGWRQWGAGADRPCTLHLPHPQLAGRFGRRLNRFAAEAQDEAGRPLLLHVPNSGRMEELLVRGAPIRYRPAGDPGRKTGGDLTLVRHAGRWVSVDARLPNRLFLACCRQGSLAPFHGSIPVETDCK